MKWSNRMCVLDDQNLCNRVSLYSVLDVAKCFTLLQYGVMGKDYCQIQCNACICVWKTSWGGWASSIIKVLHIHVVHFGTILIDCMNWLSSMQVSTADLNWWALGANVEKFDNGWWTSRSVSMGTTWCLGCIHSQWSTSQHLMNHMRRHRGKEESFYSTNLSSPYGANVVLYTPFLLQHTLWASSIHWYRYK